MEQTLKTRNDPRIRVFAVWEPVLWTDWASPSSATLRRIDDPRAAQYWDKGRLLSHALGETNRATLVWDTVLLYQPGALWQAAPPEPVFRAGPVVRRIRDFDQALEQLRSSAGP